MLRIRVARTSGAFGIAQRAALSSYLVPKSSDLTKVVDISGKGLHAPYDNVPGAGQFTTKPDALTLAGALGQATTPVLAAARPQTMTLQLFCKVNNLAGTYTSGMVPVADMFFRAVNNDVRAYVICADGSGNFLFGPALALGSWHDFALVCKPNLCSFYVDGVLAGSVAKSIRADANIRWRLGYSSSPETFGAGLIYLATALTSDQLKQNARYLRATHGYP